MGVCVCVLAALYWALGTAAGTGSTRVGPATESEIVFVLFSLVFGLAFFALLLTAVDNVWDTMLEDNKAFKDEKDDLMRFLRAQGLNLTNKTLTTAPGPLAHGCAKWLLIT